jgi:hypothetical protein
LAEANVHDSEIHRGDIGGSSARLERRKLTQRVVGATGECVRVREKRDHPRAGRVEVHSQFHLRDR